LLGFKPVTSDRIRIEILASRVNPTLANVGLFYNPGLQAERYGKGTTVWKRIKSLAYEVGGFF
jgi:hypothetical protein